MSMILDEGHNGSIWESITRLSNSTQNDNEMQTRFIWRHGPGINLPGYPIHTLIKMNNGSLLVKTPPNENSRLKWMIIIQAPLYPYEKGNIYNYILEIEKSQELLVLCARKTCQENVVGYVFWRQPRQKT